MIKKVIFFIILLIIPTIMLISNYQNEILYIYEEYEMINVDFVLYENDEKHLVHMLVDKDAKPDEIYSYYTTNKSKLDTSYDSYFNNNDILDNYVIVDNNIIFYLYNKYNIEKKEDKYAALFVTFTSLGYDDIYLIYELYK